MKKILYKDDPSGKYSRKKYLEENYIDLFNDILSYSKKYNIENIPFKEIVYCYKHNTIPPKCKNPNCNNNVKYKNSTIGYKDYCSTKCISNDPNIKKQKQEKSLEKYGTKTPAESNSVKNKIIKTNQEKYGCNSPMQLKEIQNKSKETLLKNFGVDNPQKSKKIQEKRIKNFNVDKWRVKFEESMLKKYGVKNALQSDDIKLKTKKTNLDKYGVENVNQHINVINKRVKTKRENCKFKIIDKDPNIIDINIEKNIYYMICDCGKEHTFEITTPLYKSRKQFATKFCTVCFPPYKNNISQLETDLLNFIKENYNEEIIINSKSIISPYELDIYLPNLKLAFEFNGIYWHNELNKPKNYHKIKSDLCDDFGIQLVHIYEDDWIYKQDIIKSMIINKLGKSLNKIYARKTEVKEITDNKIIKDFLNDNHIQGFVGSSVKIGLFYENELVSLMTFGKKRKNMNSISNNKNEYEMLRFCNKLNTNVIGGASKLFKYFLRNFNPIEIVSYADRSYSNGNLYNQLGFELEHITTPNYHYVVNDIRKYRYGFRKDILVKEGYDPNKSEHEIMLERKIYRIYNSGNYKFIYKI
jgi:hypothetical protein